MRTWRWLTHHIGEGRKIRIMRRAVDQQARLYRGIYEQIEELKRKRRELQLRLDQAKDEDEARLVSDRLASIADDDAKLRQQWEEVERRKARLQAAIDTAMTTSFRRSADELEGILQQAADVEVGRARTAAALSEVEQESDRRRRTAEETIRQVRWNSGEAMPLPSEAYLEQWRQSRSRRQREHHAEPPSSA